MCGAAEAHSIPSAASFGRRILTTRRSGPCSSVKGASWDRDRRSPSSGTHITTTAAAASPPSERMGLSRIVFTWGRAQVRRHEFLRNPRWSVHVCFPAAKCRRQSRSTGPAQHFNPPKAQAKRPRLASHHNHPFTTEIAELEFQNPQSAPPIPPHT